MHTISSPLHTTSFLTKEIYDLWNPILQCRSDNNDLDGCLEIRNILRESSVPINILIWEKIFLAAILTKPKKLKTQTYLSRSYLVPDLISLFHVMKIEDKIIPSMIIFKNCLNYFSQNDDTNKILEILKIMQNYEISIDQEILKEIENMKSYNVILEYLESISINL